MSKTSNEQCLANYAKMCELFRNVIPNGKRFAVVYGCGVDVGMMNFVVVRKTTYTYSSYAIGYDENEIVILPIDVGLQQYGTPYYLKKSEVTKAKRSWLNKEITIQHHALPKGYIQFSVPEFINDDPDNVCVCVKQNEQAQEFVKFFKEKYAK